MTNAVQEFKEQHESLVAAGGVSVHTVPIPAVAKQSDERYLYRTRTYRNMGME